MHKTVVYLSGGIFQLDDKDCKAWREYAELALAARGILTLNPMRRDYRHREIANCVELVRNDLLDINSSDVVLVNAKVPSWGTAMEVFYAMQQRKYIVAFNVPDPISPWLYYHTDHRCKTLAQALLKIPERI